MAKSLTNVRWTEEGGKRIPVCPVCDKDRPCEHVALLPMPDPANPEKMILPHTYSVCAPCFKSQQNTLAAASE